MELYCLPTRIMLEPLYLESLPEEPKGNSEYLRHYNFTLSSHGWYSTRQERFLGEVLFCIYLHIPHDQSINFD